MICLDITEIEEILKINLFQREKDPTSVPDLQNATNNIIGHLLIQKKTTNDGTHPPMEEYTTNTKDGGDLKNDHPENTTQDDITRAPLQLPPLLAAGVQVLDILNN